MIKLLLMLPICLIAATANAQPRESWIRKCQAEDKELLSGSTGYRVCTESYVMELQKRQKKLLRQVLEKLSHAEEPGTDPKLASAHFKRSQQLWLRYVNEHCWMAQAMFGTGHASGDAIPFCMAGEFELRNRQLGRILQGDYER